MVDLVSCIIAGFRAIVIIDDIVKAKLCSLLPSKKKNADSNCLC
jgi:hypothetical protein